MTDELPGYDGWKLRSQAEQDELDRAWARRGKRERDPDRERDAEGDREAEERDE